MSRPSAMNATFTPEPSTMFCACGVLLFWNAVFVICSASGSRSGLVGSVVHVWLLADVADFVAPPADGAAVSIGERLTGRSGKMPATDGSPASSVAWLDVSDAANALTVENPCRFFAP